MSAFRLDLAAVLLAVAAVACVVRPEPSAGPSSSPAVTPPAPSVVVGDASASPIEVEPSKPPAATPTIDPSLARGTVVSCGDGIQFAAEILLQPGRAELAIDGAALVLRSVIGGSPPEVNLPPSGWTRIDASPTRVLFVAPSPGGWSEVTAMLGPDGWTSDIEGQCHLRPVLPAGIEAAAWWIDPQVAALPADATTVHALLLEEACAGGKSPAGRVVGPSFVEDSDRVIVTFGVRTRGGDCVGNRPFALRFTLPSPLTGRTLLDGGVFPPRDARTEAP